MTDTRFTTGGPGPDAGLVRASGRTVDPVDKAVRERVAAELETTFLVEAGAGTGKTSVLVERYVACLTQTDAPISSVVAITFTEKAAGELRQRIRARLEELLAGAEPSPTSAAAPPPVVRERLAAALAGLDDAPISTIHAFAARLLRERPVEAGVDPAFVQLDQVGSELLRDRLWRDWLSGLLDTDRPAAGELDSPAAAASSFAGARLDAAGLLAEALRAGLSIKQIADLAALRFAERFAVGGAGVPQPPDLAGRVAATKREAAGVAVLAGCCADDGDRLKASSLDLVALAVGLPDGGDLHDLGRALHVAVGRAASLTPKNAGKAPSWNGRKDEMLAARDALRDEIADAAASYGAYVADLALAVAADYARSAADAQLQGGALDFDDLLGRARDLLAGAPGADPAQVAAVRGHFQRRYRYLLVDEFQDTDPLQAEIAFLLAEHEPGATAWRDVVLAPGKLFLVGDPKQSIYRFRRADIGMYDDVRELIERQGGAVVSLEQNFRTVASVVSWINGLFADLMPEPGTRGLQPSYTALSAMRSDPGPEPGVVVARPAGEPSGQSASSRTPAELCRREARFLAGLLADVERTGWRVRSGTDGAWRSATVGDVAILLPAFTHVGHYEQALREAGLPYRVDGGRTFYGRREVLDTLAVLRALDTAADQVAVYGALHSQLFAFSDDDLYEFHAAGGTFDYLSEAVPDGCAEIAAALADLRFLHERRNLRPPADTIDDLVRRTHLFESLALWADDPDQAIANVAELVSLADEFARSTEATFHAFVAKMAHDVAAADTAESPVGETGDFVRLMTVHKAKGLEFPIVILGAAMLAGKGAERAPLVDREARRLLCDLTCQSPDPERAGKTIHLQTIGFDERFAHEKRALELERVRLLYVALTRAADLLVLPLVADEPKAGSLQFMWQGGTASVDAGPDPWPGAAFTRVLQWAPVPARAAAAVAPTDPSAAREAWREERDALLARASRAAPVFAPSSLERLEPPDWADELTSSGRPSAAELAELAALVGPAAQAEPVAQAEVAAQAGPATQAGSAAQAEFSAHAGSATQAGPAARSEPGGREHALALGTAVHRVLELVALDDDERLEALAGRAAAEAGIGDDAARVAALARAVWRAAPLRGAARSPHHRELPVCVRHGATVIEGAIDLVYRDETLDGWVVVDYKTDARPQPGAIRARYGGQAGAYALAFEAATGERVAAVDVVLAALPDETGAATVVRLAYDHDLRALVESRMRETTGLIS